MSDLMTFIGGAAVGTLVTYLTKNEEARQTVERFIDSAGTNITAMLRKFIPGESEKLEPKPTKAKPKPRPRVKTAAKPAAARKPTTARRVPKAKKATAEGKAIH